MTDAIFHINYETERLQAALTLAGVSFTGTEVYHQLYQIALANGVNPNGGSALPALSAPGTVTVSATETAPGGVNGYIGGLDASRGMTASTRVSMNLTAGQRYVFLAHVTLGLDPSMSGIKEALAMPVVSGDGGTSWGAFSRIRRTQVSTDRFAMLGMSAIYVPSASGPAVFGVRFGNNDNNTIVTCLGESRDVTVFGV